MFGCSTVIKPCPVFYCTAVLVGGMFLYDGCASTLGALCWQASCQCLAFKRLSSVADTRETGGLTDVQGLGYTAASCILLLLPYRVHGDAVGDSGRDPRKFLWVSLSASRLLCAFIRKR